MNKAFHVLIFFVAVFIGNIKLSGQSVEALAAYEAKFFEGSRGFQLPYRILYPKNYDANKQYPLVLFMHGAGERGNDNERQLIHGADLFLRAGVRDSFPAIVVFPQCAERDFWVDVSREKKVELRGQELGVRRERSEVRGKESEEREEESKRQAKLSMDYPFKMGGRPSMKLVEELLQSLLASGKVDRERVYVMGLSMGGMATFELTARYPELFAAAVPICGGGNTLLAGLYAKKTNFWVFHGAKDDVVDPEDSRNMVKAIRSAGGKARYTEYPEAGHNSWDPAFKESELLPWLFAQKNDMESRRFLEPIFNEVKMETFTYAEKDGEQLQLDLYEPVGDDWKARPLLIYIHGGGFAVGERNGPDIQLFSRDLAKRGYLVVSMSYRLTMKGKSFSCDQAAANKIRTFQLVVEDIRDATNFLIENAGKFKLDKEKIILAGSSAGAEAILHAAFWNDEQLQDNCPKLPADFQYAGLINMAGAMVESAVITADNAIPILAFHGTCDPLVPFKTSPHHYCSSEEVGYLILQGSYSICEQYHKLGASYELVVGCGIGHEWAGEPMQLYFDRMVAFLKGQVLDGTFKQERVRAGSSENCKYDAGSPFCDKP